MSDELKAETEKVLKELNKCGYFEHEQVIIIENSGNCFNVDKGLEDIIKNLNDWGIDTCNSCIDNYGRTWIHICDLDGCGRFLQIPMNTPLWNFLEDKTEIAIPDNAYETAQILKFECQAFKRTSLPIGASIRFSKEELPTFKKLFLELFPPT
jgi:hypothetical protein